MKCVRVGSIAAQMHKLHASWQSSGGNTMLQACASGAGECELLATCSRHAASTPHPAPLALLLSCWLRLEAGERNRLSASRSASERLAAAICRCNTHFCYVCGQDLTRLGLRLYSHFVGGGCRGYG